MKDLFVITGIIDELKEVSIKLERKLMEPVKSDDVDFDALAELADEAENIVINLNNELID